MDAKTFLEIAPVKWAEIIDEMTPNERQEIESGLDFMCSRAALAAHYVSCRANGAEHGAAVKLARKVAIKVRKALGFSYPEAGVPSSF